MPVRIRLQRHGKKGRPFYWIVAADSRAKRDGKFLEKLGTYNPNTNPAQIHLNVDNAVKWLQHGAQPSETARRILSYKGAMLKHHLLRGVAKGALTEAEAEKKFQAWVEEKAQRIETKKDSLAKAKADAKAKTLEAEKEVSEKRKASLETVEEPEATPDTSETPVEASEKPNENENTEAAPQEPTETPQEEVTEDNAATVTSSEAAGQSAMASAAATEDFQEPPGQKGILIGKGSVKKPHSKEEGEDENPI